MDSRAVTRTLRVPAEDLPLALATVHAALPVGTRWSASFSGWVPDALHAVIEGGGFAVSNAEHKEMVEAIASSDADRAGRVMRAHAANSRARMHKATDTTPVKRTSTSR